jgi:hypothetical protein
MSGVSEAGDRASGVVSRGAAGWAVGALGTGPGRMVAARRRVWVPGGALPPVS